MSNHQTHIRLVDRDAFAELFHSTAAALTRYARTITGDDEAALDVVQDVFARLWEKRHDLVVETSAKALLYTMVRNRALNDRRRRSRFVDEGAGDNSPGVNAVPVDEQMHASDIREKIRRWIDQLPPRRAEAFALSRYHGLTHEQIAGVMGVSKRTVDAHILLALKHLRERLALYEGKGL